MKRKIRKPAWWQLYLLMPVMALLLGAAQIEPFPNVSKEVADILIIVFTFGSMVAWAWINRVELDEDYMDRYLSADDLKITIYEPLSQQEKNREFSHGVPPLARSGQVTSAPESIAMEEMESAK